MDKDIQREELYRQALNGLDDTTIYKTEDAFSVNASSVEPIDFEWIWKDRIPLGVPVIINGDSGIGKTFLWCDIVAHVTTGTSWPDGSPCMQGDVIVVSSEDTLETTLGIRMRHAHADMTKVHDLSRVPTTETTLNSNSVSKPFQLPDDFQALERAIVANDAILVVLDPVSGTIRNSTNTPFVREKIMTPLIDMCSRLGITCLMINHKAKGRFNERNVLTGIANSRAFIEASRVVYIATRDATNQATVDLSCYKSIVKKPDIISYRIAENAIGETRVEWLKKADDVSHSQRENETQKKIIRAIYLEGRPLRPFQVARRLGLPEATIRQACRRMAEKGYLKQIAYGVYALPDDFPV
jgi:RecA-family ATPase